MPWPLALLGAAMTAVAGVAQSQRKRKSVSPWLRWLAFNALGFSLGFSVPLLAAWVSARARRQRFRVEVPKVRRIVYEEDEVALERLRLALPAWVRDPGLEKVLWINQLLARLWPMLRAALDPYVCNKAWPMIAGLCGVRDGVVELRRFSLGDFPLTLDYVRAIKSPDEECVVEARVQWASNCSAVAEVALLPGMGGLLVHLSEVCTAAVLRVTLAPLMGDFPCFSALRLSLVDKPELDARLSVLEGWDLLSVGPIRATVLSAILGVLESMMVWPRWWQLQVAEVAGLLASGPRRAVGILHLDVKCARDLMCLFAPSPVLKAYIEPARVVTTKPMYHTADPNWREVLRLPVADPDSDVAVLEVRDSSAMLMVDLIGRCHLPINTLKGVPCKSLSLSLLSASGVPAGTVELVASYVPLHQTSLPRGNRKEAAGARRTSSPLLPPTREAPPPLGALLLDPGVVTGDGSREGSSLRAGLLEVTVQRAVGLELSLVSAEEEEMLFCRLLFAGDEQHTTSVSVQSDARWSETFDFLCEGSGMREPLSIELWHSAPSMMVGLGRRNRLLGAAAVGVADVVHNSRMVDVFPLQGLHGALKVELVWKYQ